MMTRDEFFASIPAVDTVDVDVPKVGRLRVRMMTAGDRDRYEQSAQGSGAVGTRARLIVASVVGDDGKPFFTADDVPAISAAPSFVIEPLVNAILRLNAVTSADIEAIAKN